MNALPFVDQTGKTIQSMTDWNFARNQQRNWETIMQIISLRAQPTIIKYPSSSSNAWEFIFDVETPAVYSATGDVNNYDTLLNECNNIPMVTGLHEVESVSSSLMSRGDTQNIWFETVNI